MCDQLYIMLLMVGIHASVGKYKIQENKIKYGKISTDYYYRIFIPASEIYKIKPYMKSDKIPENFEHLGIKRSLSFFTEDENGVKYFARSIQSLEEFKYTGLSYDIQIDPERSYVCSGFKVSNCRFFAQNEPTIASSLRFYSQLMTQLEKSILKT